MTSVTERIRNWIEQYDSATDTQATLDEFTVIQTTSVNETEMLYLETLIGLCHYDLGKRRPASNRFSFIALRAAAQGNQLLTLRLAWYAACLTLESYSELAKTAPDMAASETDLLVSTFKLIVMMSESMQHQYYLGMARSILAELAVRNGDSRRALTEAQLSTTALMEFGSDPDARASICLSVNRHIVESNGKRSTALGDASTETTDWSILTYLPGELLSTLPE